MSEKKIVLIIPAYNEELTIAETIFSFNKIRPDIEIWVIDNRSSDETYNVALNAIIKMGAVGGVLREKKRGKANAVRKAFAEIDADIYLMVDGDNTYPAVHVDALISKVELGADMVIGDRISNGSYGRVIDRRFHQFGNNFVLGLVNYFFNARLSDILSGYRGLSKRFVKSYPILVEGFELETDMTLFGLFHKFNVEEVDVGYDARPEGSLSKLNTISDGARVIFTFFQIVRYYKPMKWFSICALIFACCGMLTSIPVIIEWVDSGYISHVPLAILSTGLELFAIVLLCIGLTLDSISYHEQQRIQQSLLKFKN